MRDWLKTEPVVLVRGQGSVLFDVRGRQYLDANSSIWTNLHGHNHPGLNRAIASQLRKVSHTSALGFASAPASLLAEQLVKAAEGPMLKPAPSRTAPSSPRPACLAGDGLMGYKAFFGDDGSTANEAALKMAFQYARRTRGAKHPSFLSLAGAYHGDTVGAVALGHIDLFHEAFRPLLFRTEKAMAPYCYRCPYNRARPERADARDYRKCNWECVDKLDRAFAKKKGSPWAGLVVEPLMQGAAGMIPQPEGWLRRAAELTRARGALLLADEVMTGFGRTANPDGSLFACQREGVKPDLLSLAKGLTGGYLPMGATLASGQVFDAFLGEYAEFKTFFHGHSYCGNQLASAAALASLEELQSRRSLESRRRLERAMAEELSELWKLNFVGDIRRVGLVAGIELVRDWRTREPFELREQAGIRVCRTMARRGVLTRPIGNVLVLMPPYCTTPEQVRKMVQAMAAGIRSLTG